VTRQGDEERRLLAVMGMAAGLSAVFRSPIGTALFAIEVLYSDMEFEGAALLYALLAAVVAYSVNGAMVGYGPLFSVPPDLATPRLSDYPWYAGLGLAAGVVATILPSAFYRTRDLFRALPLPDFLKPAIGGLAVGLLGVWTPQVLGGGYGWIQMAIGGNMALGLLVTLLFAKMAAFALTVGSGGSGGVFAPSLFVGAMLGGSVAHLVGGPAAGFVVVGMAAVFAGAARVPIATLLMVTEMTEGYHLLAPAALAVTASWFVQATLSAPLYYRSLYEAQVPDRADSPAHHVEQLESVIHLLGRRRERFPGSVSHMSLRALLAAGVPVDLPGGKQVFLGVLRPHSPLAGRRLEACAELTEDADVEPVAVLRAGRTLLASGGATLRTGDRLVAVVTPEGRARLAPHFTAPKPVRGA
jgi:CIC family chloride channel protein